jgi:hypothetical protein
VWPDEDGLLLWKVIEQRKHMRDDYEKGLITAYSYVMAPVL